MSSRTQLANEAWEALFRAQVVLMRTFAADDIWTEVSQTEYDVLYTLAKSPDGLTSAEVNRDILMTQGGVSKLVTRLVERGLVERCSDPTDRRSARLVLTEAGRNLQRHVGRRHALAVARAMDAALSPEQMEQVRGLGRQIVTMTEARQDLCGGTHPTTNLPTTTTERTNERASA